MTKRRAPGNGGPSHVRQPRGAGSGVWPLAAAGPRRGGASRLRLSRGQRSERRARARDRAPRPGTLRPRVDVPAPVAAMAAIADVRPPVADVAAPAELAGASRRLVADDHRGTVPHDDPGAVAEAEVPTGTRYENDGSRTVSSVEGSADRGDDLGLDTERYQGLVGDALALQETTRGLESAELGPRRPVPLSGRAPGIEPRGREGVLEPGDLRGSQVIGDLPDPLARVGIDDLDHPDRRRGGDSLLREEARGDPGQREGTCKPNVSI